MSDFDRFETPYHKLRFPDQQEAISNEYSTCNGCGEAITESEVALGEVVDVYGMCIHDNLDCIKKAVQAKTICL